MDIKNHWEPWQKNTLFAFWIAFFLSTPILLALNVFDIKEAGLLLGTGITILLFACIDQLQYFKGLGIEAKLKEKVQEADDVLNKLKSLAITHSKNLNIIGAALNRSGNYSNKIRHELFTKTEELLRELNIPESDIDQIHKYHRFFTRIDLAKAAYSSLNTTLWNYKSMVEKHLRDVRTAEGKNELQEPVEGLIRNLTKIIKNLNPVISNAHNNKSIQILEDNLNEFKNLVCNKDNVGEIFNYFSANPELDIKNIKEEIEDFKYYQEHKSHRNLEKWLSIKSEDDFEI